MSTDFSRPELPAQGIVAALADEDRSLLSNYGEFLPVQPGQTIISEGNAQDSLYFVISGVLHVHTDSQTRRTLIARAEAGETLGEVNVFDPGTASASVTAQDFTQVWRANREDIDAFVTAYPEAGARLLAALVTLMSRRIRRMNERLAAKELESEFHDFWH
ncbi:cyclic nucleotide-binding domain-containing protein [Luteolibacter ambystomatis]|uniref:Cyclic nucleotide-binding domain-containing protein n=1 Tax=Luteolibacter ambystomatis TaxID=2824561 RepID=A0A975G534_9BACT|nr:cyclic nucleotide-binding domain-containing protein [Luteolibacter ambystomatis]QUE49489.1 cyclic nucleotide-binding domain-containing protein [Luteolibacter ambystomatis]